VLQFGSAAVTPREGPDVLQEITRMPIRSRIAVMSAATVVAAVLLTAARPAGAQQTSPDAAPRASRAAAPQASSPAGSQPVGASGFYVGLASGVESRSIGVDINLGTAAEWSTGFGVSPAFGYSAPSNAWRVEFELSTLDNPNVGFYFPPYPNGPREQSAGHVTLRSLMLNLYYDVPLAPKLRRLQPYIGAGLGATESRIDGVTTKTLQAGIPGVFGPTVLDTASRYTRSWQIRLGAGFQLTDRVVVFGGYRHFETELLKFKTIQFPDVQVTGANIEEAEGGIRVFF
jgi:opacity protein-like surface antigen